jgi:hypothetical protein
VAINVQHPSCSNAVNHRRRRRLVAIIIISIIITSANTITIITIMYKDWAFWPIPIPGLVELVLPSLQ